jgi:hypothetical protein
MVVSVLQVRVRKDFLTRLLHSTELAGELSESSEASLLSRKDW